MDYRTHKETHGSQNTQRNTWLIEDTKKQVAYRTHKETNSLQNTQRNTWLIEHTK